MKNPNGCGKWQWFTNAGYQEHIFSYVNNINTIEGGTHVAGLGVPLPVCLRTTAINRVCLKKAKVAIRRGMPISREGISAIISVKFRNPSLKGRLTKTRQLKEVMGIVVILP